MSGMIGKDQLEDIRARNDIVDVVGAYVQLKRAGTSLKGLCPFHKEKTPSFHVNPQRQIFHCFGCGAGGDVFGFVMEYESLDFPAAARLLAERSGIQLTLEEGGHSRGPRKDQLIRVLDEAAAFYHRVLTDSAAGSGARAYLNERKMSGEMIEGFGIGFAPNRRGTLETWAAKHDFDTGLLVAAGLLARAEERNELYERFRDRLMFPIRDEMGRVIGFSGRIMNAEARVAKYVNSPETAVFHKNRVLFGLDKARRAILDTREAIICEGQIDVIRCHEAGFPQAIAAQGTAFTEHHARIVKRYADAAVLVLDSDRAGEDAAIRGGELLMAEGLSVRVAALPAGEDPDSLLLAQGAEPFRALIEKAQSVVDFQIDVLSGREQPGSEPGLNRTTRAVLATVARVPSRVQQERLLQQASTRLGVSETALREDLRRTRRTQRRARTEPQATDTQKATVVHPAEEVALAELVAGNMEVTDLVRTYLPLDLMTDPHCRTLVNCLLEQRDPHTAGPEDPTDQAAYRQLAARVQMAPHRVIGEDRDCLDAAKDTILVIRRKSVERRRRELLKQLDTSEETQRRHLEAACAQATLDISLLRKGWEQALPILDL